MSDHREPCNCDQALALTAALKQIMEKMSDWDLQDLHISEVDEVKLIAGKTIDRWGHKEERTDNGYVLYPDLKDAFLGEVSRFGWHTPVACYDRSKVIDILMRDGCSWEDAEEWFSYNTIGAWVGEGTPVFLEKGSI